MEVMVTLPLVMLLFGGTLALFTQAQRVVQRTGVAVQSSQDAAIGIQVISSTTREAIQFALPPDTSAVNTNGMAFLPPDGTLSHYQNGASNTAVELLLPAAAASIKATGQPATPGLSVLDKNGLAITPVAYDRTQTEVSGGNPVSPLRGDLVWIYRGDTLGTPSPSTGSCFWALTRPAGSLVGDASHDTRRRLCRLVLTAHPDGTAATDAVQFVGSRTPGSDIPGTMPYELEFKLVCGDRTLLRGGQSSEADSSGNVSTLSGKCALMRNHN